MDPSKFDELTKALAISTSRRQAFRRIGGILAGVSLAGLFPGLAFAKNKTCAQFCASVFGDNTPAAEQCTADAAHGTGLCYTCGSTTPASSICCTRNTSGFCTSYSGATCCGSGATCLGSSCCASANVCGSTCLAAPCDSSQCLTCNPTSGTCVSTCSSGQTCQNGMCVTPPVCPSGGDFCSFAVVCGTYGGGYTCYCATDVDGSNVCSAATQTAHCAFCTSDADCGANMVCIQAPSCCTGVGGSQGTFCAPRC